MFKLMPSRAFIRKEYIFLFCIKHMQINACMGSCDAVCRSYLAMSYAYLDKLYLSLYGHQSCSKNIKFRIRVLTFTVGAQIGPKVWSESGYSFYIDGDSKIWALAPIKGGLRIRSIYLIFFCKLDSLRILYLSITITFRIFEKPKMYWKIANVAKFY